MKIPRKARGLSLLFTASVLLGSTLPTIALAALTIPDGDQNQCEAAGGCGNG